jgi:stress-induced morphogen
MMRQFSILLLLTALGFAKEQKSIDQLKAEAEKATGSHQAQLYAELAERTVDVADQQFTQGESVQGHETVKQVLEYATKAHGLALESRRKMKEVEIHLRETQRHLTAVRRTLAADDRPALEAVEKKLADFRQDLLDAMFMPKKQKETKQ